MVVNNNSVLLPVSFVVRGCQVLFIVCLCYLTFVFCKNRGECLGEFESRLVKTRDAVEVFHLLDRVYGFH